MPRESLELKQFEWDHFNADKIRQKHKVEPRECEEVFFNYPLVAPDVSHSTIEKRYSALGKTNTGRLLYIIFTERKGKIRVISAWNANKKQRRLYYENAKESEKNTNL